MVFASLHVTCKGAAVHQEFFSFLRAQQARGKKWAVLRPSELGDFEMLRRGTWSGAPHCGMGSAAHCGVGRRSLAERSFETLGVSKATCFRQQGWRCIRPPQP